VNQDKVNKKYLFSTEGLDLSDDSAIDEFARTVWEAFMDANGDKNNDETQEQ
jgi:hypothetical protein